MCARRTRRRCRRNWTTALRPAAPPPVDFEAIVVGRLGYSPFRANASERVIVRIEPVGTSSGRANRMAGRDGRMDRRADVSVAHRRLRRARARDGIRARPADSADGDDDGRASPAGGRSPLRRRRRGCPAAADRRDRCTDRDRPGRHDEVRAQSSRPSITSGAGARGGTRRRVERRPARAPASVPSSGRTSRSSSRARSARHRRRIGLTARASRSSSCSASLAGCGVRPAAEAAAWSQRSARCGWSVRELTFPRQLTGFVVLTGLRLAVTHMLGSRVQIGVHADGLALITQGSSPWTPTPVWTTPRFAALFGADIGVRFR